MSINNKGQLSCPTCSKLKRTLTVTGFAFNDLKYYTVKTALNIIVDKLVLQEELDELVKTGVEVKIL